MISTQPQFTSTDQKRSKQQQQTTTMYCHHQATSNDYIKNAMYAHQVATMGQRAKSKARFLEKQRARRARKAMAEALPTPPPPPYPQAFTKTRSKKTKKTKKKKKLLQRRREVQKKQKVAHPSPPALPAPRSVGFSPISVLREKKKRGRMVEDDLAQKGVVNWLYGPEESKGGPHVLCEERGVWSRGGFQDAGLDLPKDEVPTFMADGSSIYVLSPQDYFAAKTKCVMVFNKRTTDLSRWFRKKRVTPQHVVITFRPPKDTYMDGTPIKPQPLDHVCLIQKVISCFQAGSMHFLEVALDETRSMGLPFTFEVQFKDNYKEALRIALNFVTKKQVGELVRSKFFPFTEGRHVWSLHSSHPAEAPVLEPENIALPTPPAMQRKKRAKEIPKRYTSNSQKQHALRNSLEELEKIQHLATMATIMLGCSPQ